MQLSASNLVTLYRPSRCELRVHLSGHGEPASPPSEYDEILQRLGDQHERAHLGTLGQAVRLDAGTRAERERLTRQAVADGAEVIYQPALRSSYDLNGERWEIVGDPDFLIRRGDGYVVRDCKIAHRIERAVHPEILLQLELYGWLYECTFDAAPIALEVHCGTGDVVQLGYHEGTPALRALREVAQLLQSGSEPYSPVGWSKCGPCGYHDRCWPAAVERHDVALVYGVDQWIARALRDADVRTYDELLARYDETALAAFGAVTRRGRRRVGKKAASVLVMARAMAEHREIVLRRPAVPAHPNYVMFDLEGMPPLLERPAEIYLWGMQVYGTRPGPFRPAVSDFGHDADRRTWQSFLAIAARIFEEYGDLPFVHWYSYEKTNIELYVERFGDPDGTAARVLANLLDLLPITQESVALPLPSYGLKVVEKYIGVTRVLPDTGGDWAMARYVEATECEDPARRKAIMDQIVLYNREDLQATWAVLEWLRKRQRARTA